jgi:predicted dehydrogenase
MERNKEPLRVCIAGAGRIAKVYAEAIETIACQALVQVSAIADPDSTAAKTLGDRLKCLTFLCAREMVEDISPDAIVICSPPNTHASIACHALKRGVAVLCEKPLGVNFKNSFDIIEMSRISGSFLMMSSRFRYADDILGAMRVIESEELGQVMRVDQIFALKHDLSNDWRSNPMISGGGILIDKGPQSFDLMRLLLGPITSVLVESSGNSTLAVEDCVVVKVKVDRQRIGSSLLSWRGEDDSDTFAKVTMEKGEILLGWTESRFRRFNGDWKRLGDGYRRKQAFQAQLDNFIAAARGEQSMTVGLDDALATAEAIAAGYLSLKNGGWIDIP